VSSVVPHLHRNFATFSEKTYDKGQPTIVEVSKECPDQTKSCQKREISDRVLKLPESSEPYSRSLTFEALPKSKLPIVQQLEQPSEVLYREAQAGINIRARDTGTHSILNDSHRWCNLRIMNNGCNDQSIILWDRAVCVPRIGAGMEPARLTSLLPQVTSQTTSAMTSASATGSSPNTTSHARNRARHSRPMSNLGRRRFLTDILTAALLIVVDQRANESQ
jgi:hypothetical protein